MIRALLAVILAPFLPADAPPGRTRLPSWWLRTAGSGWIALAQEEDQPLLVIPVTIDGQPGWALVDTGCEGMFLTKRYAEAHGLTLRPYETAESFGGKATFYFTSGVSMAIGAMHTESPGTFAVTDVNGIDDVIDHPFDAIIGMGMLGYVGWEVDQDHRRIRFLPSGTKTPGAHTLLRHRADGSRMVADIQIAGRAPIAATLDTGSDSEMDLSPATAEQTGVKMTTDIAGIGLGGPQVNAIGHAPPIRIGEQTVTGARVEIDPRFEKVWGSGVQAMIGMGLLRRYNLSVDFAGGGLALRPRTTPVRPLPNNTSGVQSRLVNGHIQIVHVMLNSPAATAGLKAGDTICGVNDWTAADAFAHHWGRAAPGTRYAVHLCDSRTLPLVTRAFY